MEDKKTYPSSSVTITTEEYRDLIAEASSAKQEADRYRDSYWSERAKTDKIQKELDAVTAEKKALAYHIKTLEAPKTGVGRLVAAIKEALRC